MLADIDRFLFENFKSLFLNDLEEPANRVEKSPELGPMPSGSSSATSESEIAEEQTVIPGNCVVVLANSVNPSKDFQRSMESVVEARLRNCEKVDWDFMQELLFCHMNLNNKK
ncbi:hypothetical protein AAZX31_08G204000 [Glycine max]